VAVISEVGKGTSVRLYLPRATGSASAVERLTPQDSVAPSGVKILLVEDNPDVAEAGAALLDELGYEVRIVSGADAALELLRKGQKFDLVFSDIVMAGSYDGVGLARLIRKEFPQLPIILATGFSRSSEAVTLEFPLLRKPFDLAELGRTVANVLAESRLTQGQSNLVDFSDARKALAAKADRNKP
jgi:CheY-like chemotaxis protein